MKAAYRDICLLEPGALDGYPMDYLIARLRGRRGLLISDWAGLIFSPEPQLPSEYGRYEKGRRPEEMAYRVLRARMRWLYRHMQRPMRECYAPLFLMHEAGAIFSALRLKEASAGAESVAAVLRGSLLSGGTRAALMDESLGHEETFSIIAGALNRMSGISPEEAGLVRARHAQRTIREHEAIFNEALMQWAASSACRPELRAYFRHLVDMTNLLAAQKRLRWGASDAEAGGARLMSGGSIQPRRLRRMSEPELRAAAFRLARAEDDGIRSMEAAMLRGLKLRMWRLAREGSAHGAMLSYAAGAALEARDLSLVLGVRDRLDEGRIRAEMAS